MFDQLIAHAQRTAATEVATRNLAAYDARDGLTPGNDNGTWDLMQAAKLAENVRALLAVVQADA